MVYLFSITVCLNVEKCRERRLYSTAGFLSGYAWVEAKKMDIFLTDFCFFSSQLKYVIYGKGNEHEFIVFLPPPFSQFFFSI